MIKSSNELVETIKVSEKIKEMRRIKKINIAFIMYKMFKISAETFAKNYVYNIIDKEKKLCLGKKDIGEKLGVQNIYNLVDKETKGKWETNNPIKQPITKYKRHGSKLLDGEEFVYTHEDIIMPIIMSCRVPAPEAIEFRSKLRLKQHDIILSKEQSIMTKIAKLFSNEKILPQHSILGYKIDLNFLEHKLAIEVDE